MRRFRISLLIILGAGLLLHAHRSFAQKPPNIELGFNAERVYQFSDLDSVNLFNGNLIVTVPIGQTYAVNAFSYRFALVYNGKVWDYEDDSSPYNPSNLNTAPPPIHTTAWANWRSNAGLGWRLSFGRLLKPGDGISWYNDDKAWIYEDATGSEHSFGPPDRSGTGSLDDYQQDPILLSRDQAAIRMVRKTAKLRHLEFPNGEVHEFQEFTNTPGRWWLTKIRDRFDNSLAIEYEIDSEGRATEWRLTDSQQRRHRVTFTNFNTTTDSFDLGQHVSSIELDTVAGTSTYGFDVTAQDIDWGCGNYPNPVKWSEWPAKANLPLLNNLRLPDDSVFQFDYEKTSNVNTCAQGALTAMTLPTRGVVRYEYQRVMLPESSCFPSRFNPLNPGVKKKTVTVEGKEAVTDYVYALAPKTALTSFELAEACKFCRNGSEDNQSCLEEETDSDQRPKPQPLHRWTRTSVLSPAVDGVRTRSDSYFYGWNADHVSDVLRPVTGSSADAIFHFAQPVTTGAPSDADTFSETASDVPISMAFSSDAGASAQDKAPHFLSTRLFGGCPSTDGAVCSGGRLLRSTYMNYPSFAGAYGGTGIMEPVWFYPPQSVLTRQHLEAGDAEARAGCAEPCLALTANDLPDGLHKYRRVTEKSRIEGDVPSTTLTNYATPALNAVGTHTEAGGVITPVTPWLLNIYDRTERTEADQKAIVDYCFDPITGFLAGVRARAGAERGGGDTFTAFSSFKGLPAFEKSYARRENAAFSLEACPDTGTMALQYVTRNTFSNGVLEKSEACDTTQASDPGCASVLTRQHVVTHPTGAPMVSYDSAGVATHYAYDDAGRLRRVAAKDTSPVPGTGTSTFNYSNATASARAKVVETVRDEVTNDALGETTYEFDGLGRVISVTKVLPRGMRARVETTYDAMGRKASVSEPFDPDLPDTRPVTITKYDALGRALTVTRPDDSQIRFDYGGDHFMRRSANVQTPQGEAEAVVTEHYDRSGRLRKVVENSHDTSETRPRGDAVRTLYSYDIGGRLTEVRTEASAAITPQAARTFEYDRRGWLLKETHPENGTTTYSGHDARGHATSRTSGGKTLTFVYDAAERLTEVRRGATTLKKFEFATANAGTDLRQGKLVSAARRNELLSGPVVWVTESYAYDNATGKNPAGQLSKKTTEVDEEAAGGNRINIQAFSQTVEEYDAFRQPKTMSMPACGLNGCATPKAISSISYAREKGLLSTVAGPGGIGAALTYHPSGMVRTVTHTPSSNAIAVDVYEQGDGLSRPSHIRFSGPSSCSQASVAINAEDSLCPSEPGTAWVVGVEGTEYYWSIAGGTLTSPKSAEKVTFKPSGLEPVTLTVTASGACGASNTSRTITIADVPAIPAIQVQTALCPNSTNNLATVAALPGHRYDWTLSDGTRYLDRPAIYFPVGSDPVTLTVTVTNSCGLVTTAQRSVGIGSNCATTWPCAIDWATPLLPRYFAVNPNNPLTLTASVKLVRPEGAQATEVPPFTDLTYTLTWYQDDVLSQTNNSGSASTYLLRFIDQARVRVEATVRCTNGRGGMTTSPPIESRTYAWVNGYCPVPEVTLKPTVYQLTDLSVKIRATIWDVDSAVQWYRGESGNVLDPIEGSTDIDEDAGHQVSELTVTKPGTFWLRARMACGTHTDSPTVVVSTGTCSPVRIVTEPHGTKIAAGSDVTLRVEADGSPAPYVYRWWAHDGSVLGGNGSQSITVSPLRTTDYSVDVGNGCSSSYSRAARVHVVGCGEIAFTQPADTAIAANEVGTLAIVATTPGLLYQWYIGESGDTRQPVAGATSPSLQLQPQDGIATQYWVRLSFADPNRCTVDSRTVNVCNDPVVHDPLASDYSNAVPKQWRVLSIGATGPSLSYAWFEGRIEDGESRPLNSVSNAVAVWPLDTSRYWVKVTSNCAPGMGTRTLAFETRVSVPPVVQSVTSSKWVTKSSIHQLSVVAGGADLTYQWYRRDALNPNPTLLTDQRSTSFTTPPVTANATFFCRVFSGIAYTDSEDVVLSVLQPRAITVATYPNSMSGSLVVLEIVSPDQTESYEWYRGASGDTSNPIPGGGLQQSLHPLETTSYWLRTRREGAAADSASLVVAVCLPAIVTQPEGGMVVSGSSKTLTVSATGTPSLIYRWYKGPKGDVTSLAAETSSPSYTTPITLASDTDYWVRVSSPSAGCSSSSTDSEAATVTVCHPPDISIQPASLIAGASGATVSVTATGTELSYQWYVGSRGDTTSPVGSGVSAGLTITPAMTTSYWVRVRGLCGASVDSLAATVSVAPTITTQPMGGAVTAGTTRTLSIAASGSQLSYEWYQRSGTAATQISGAASVSYTTPPITAAATFFCRVKSAAAFKDSSDAVLTVCQARSIAIQGYPSAVSGSLVSVQIVDPAADETYQWYQGASGNTAVPLGTGTSLSVQPLATTDYWARTIRSGCHADSPAVTVRVCYPAISQQPAGGTIVVGSQKTLTVAATGTPTMTYQWYRGARSDTSSPETGATLSSYTTPATLIQTTSYWVRVSSPSAGCASSFTDSEGATVTICHPPKILTEPASVIAGASGATLSVTASGTELAYQWYAGSRGDTTSPLVGGASASLTVTPAMTTSYWVRVRGICGASVDSLAATVSVAPTITTQPVGAAVTSGATRTLSITASGSQLSYEWYQRNGTTSTKIAGATSTSYTTPPITTTLTFFGRVHSAAAYKDSSDAVLTVCQPRSIAVQGYPSTVSGSLVSIQIVAPAADETYQWYQGATGNTAVPLGTETSLSLRPVATTDYWARTIRSGCHADSPAVTVRICYPAVTEQPTGGAILTGGQKTLTVSATGTPVMTYQWYRGAKGDTSAPVSGATSASFTTPALTQTTSYWVRITSPSGGCTASSTDSEAATVMVCQPPVITEQPRSDTYPKNAALTLTVTVTGDGLQYQWYRGVKGDTSSPIGDNLCSITLTATATQAYWVRTTGSCATVDSDTALVSVFPVITQHPANASVCGSGSPATFTVAASGAESYQWFRRVSGSADEQVGTGATLTLPISVSPTYVWARAYSGAASTPSNQATATITPTPVLSSFTAPSYAPNQYTLTAVVSSPASPVGYRFYQGALGNTATLIVDSTQNYRTVTPPYRPISYWVRAYYTNNPTKCFADAGLTIDQRG